VCALAAYAVLTAAMTWPLALQIGHVVPKDLGDPLFSVWALWWNASVWPFSPAWWHGPIFAPQSNALALADHRVGLGLIATPLIWAGASPLGAYGVVFLASFAGSAAAAYALCVALGTGRAAAFAGGLVFGFHPFRAAHLEHVELLSAYWLALTLLGLHRWRISRRWTALAGVALTLVLQGLTAGYYFFFAGVLLAGWAGWFALRDTSWRQRAELAAAFAVPLVVLAPMLWRYRAVHAALGLSRTITEIETLSADLAGLVTPPDMLAFWNTPHPVGHPEGALFPGLTAVSVILLALWRQRAAPAAVGSAVWRSRLRWLLAGVGLLVAAIAAVAAIAGPFAVGLGPVRLSVGALYKPLSLVALCAAGWLALSPRLADAWRRESLLAFYVLATAAMWMLALGPTARLFGERVLYKAPYAWLMALPGFADAFRAPARFAMLAALTLAVAAALALNRLTGGLSPRARVGVVGLVAAGALADGWLDRLPLPVPPPALAAIASLPRDEVVLELPLGTFEDLAAMYRATTHRRPLANGYSGYEPAHYTVLRTALEDGQMAVLAQLIPDRHLTVVVAPTAAGAVIRDAVLRQVPGTQASHVDGVDLVAVPRRQVPPAAPRGPSLPISNVTASVGAETGRAIDGALATAWQTPGPQAGGEQVRVDLGDLRRIAGVELQVGRFVFAYPRRLLVEVSADGTAWSEVWRGEVATAALAAARAAPAAVPILFAVPTVAARYLRLTQEGASAHPWAIAELAVLGPALP
jgi:hypothetical protein